MIQNVKFGDYHCKDDLGMLLASKDIEAPTVQTHYVEIPGRDGTLDLTEALSGHVAYYDRTITLTFVTCENISKEEWPAFLSNVLNAIHGQRLHIIFDDDPEYYYDGRCEITKYEMQNGKWTLTIACTCDPYKYKISDPEEKSL